MLPLPGFSILMLFGPAYYLQALLVLGENRSSNYVYVVARLFNYNAQKVFVTLC